MHRIVRKFGVGLGLALLLGACGAVPTAVTQPTSAAAVSGTGHTVVSIQGTKFYINGAITSPGKPAEGLLLNVRMAQAIFDDENSSTVNYWAYPDTHKWDPQRNTDEFVAMIPTYARYGVRMITVGLQGGCPSSSPNPPCPGGDHDWIVTAFNADGSLKPAWMSRLNQVITAADHNGMVVLVQLFYHGQNQRLDSPDSATAQKAAVDNITDWLVHGGYTNVMVETANECNAGYQPYTDCGNEAAVIKQVQDRSQADGHRLAAAVSYTGDGMPSDDVLAQEDFVLLHGNGIDATALVNLIDRVKNDSAYKNHATPIVVNEDSTSIDNMNAAVAAGVSWGDLDTGLNNYHDGFQRPPVNWTINTNDKKAFFDNALRLAGPTLTSLVYSGPSQSDYHDDLTMTATLTDTWGNPLVGESLNFALGGQTCSGITGPGGDTACTLTPSTPGSTTVSVSYGGSDQFLPVSQSLPFTVGPEQTALVYQGDSTFINGTSGTLAAVLTEDGTTPLPGRTVQFTLGSGPTAQACSATTDAGGVASCTPGSTNQPLGSAAASAAFAGDDAYAPATAGSEVEVAAMASGLTYTGPTSGDFNDPVTLTAALASGESPVSGEAIAFTLGSQTCVGHTDAHGVAGCIITPALNAGDYTLSVGFVGDPNYKPSSTSATFTVLKEQSSLIYSGDTALRNGAGATLSATLTEDGDSTSPLAGRPITFALGSGSSSQTCTATTSSTGHARCSIASVQQAVGAGTVTATFAGDATYQAASDHPATQVLAAATPPAPVRLATTGQAPAAGRPWWPQVSLGAVILLLGLLLFVLPRRREGDPAPLIWRNRE